jgi:hypothetical protein
LAEKQLQNALVRNPWLIWDLLSLFGKTPVWDDVGKTSELNFELLLLRAFLPF